MTRIRSTALILVLATLAFGACSSHRTKPAAARTAPATSPLPAPFTPAAKDGTIDYSTPKPPKIAMPRWNADRSDIGGFPFPRGWYATEPFRKGYERSEGYAAPNGVTLEQLFIWYLARVPQNRSWGEWTPCFPAGNGGGLDQYGRQAWWAFHNPRNPDHVITVDMGQTENGEVELIIARSIDDECE